ncbi:MAG: helix-turn-helix transcriptional regulator [Clostridia bacterium]|nr:helix-turn-helix transcriptional regulator [Clostridia bacterium]
MWREKIIEAKKAKGLTTKMMSERSPSHMPEETITRILNGKTEFPRIDSVLDLCEQVGLSPWELFEETTSRISDGSVIAMQEEVDMLKFERDALLRENGVLNDKVETLRNKVEELKDEIIAVHNYYIKQKSN